MADGPQNDERRCGGGCGDELDLPDDIGQPGLEERAGYDGANTVGHPEAGAEEGKVGPAQPHGGELGCQGGPGDPTDDLAVLVLRVTG